MRIAWLLALLAGAASAEPAAGVATYAVRGDGIDTPLTDAVPDPQRGRRIATDGQLGNCTICHALPTPEVPAFGNVGPPLGGVGSRLSTAQLRLRIVDARRIDPDSIMPAYHRVDGRYRVEARYAGRPMLDAQSVEDVVAYLKTLQ